MSEDSQHTQQSVGARNQSEVIDLTGLTLNELRNARRRLESDEQELSFVRRVLHGRIDILKAEVRRRAGEGDAVLSQLSQILADGPKSSRATAGRRNVDVDGPIQANAIAVAADQADQEVAALDLRTISDELLAQSLRTLEQHEVAVSQARSLTHDRLDRMGSELTRRYREGTAQVDDLLAAARRK